MQNSDPKTRHGHIFDPSLLFINQNAASTPSFMPQNSPVHPVARTSFFRREVKIQPAESDLNEIIAQSLAGLKKISDVNLVWNFHPLPKIFIDPEELSKVVAHLAINAREAVAPGGKIQIETKRQNGWAILSVSDDGCGMNSVFLNGSLFRPFQTTKKNGLGIGLFESKKIVEAHKGRIEVESAPGNGTTFRVYLPIHK